ncbi:hypothetical protein ACS0TY_025642 [Phlomoides rotata]
MEPPNVVATRVKKVLPCLMLPSSFAGIDVMASSLEDEFRLLGVRRSLKDESGVCESRVVGSSHGWVVLFNHKRRHGDLFLWDPISGRQIKLPPMKTLPDAYPPCNGGRASMNKVIISCSPDRDKCRAMMIYGAGQSLAYCHPGRIPRWTRICEMDEDEAIFSGKCYEDFVYSDSRKQFFCLTRDDELEAWDFTASSPILVWSVHLDDFHEDDDWAEENLCQDSSDSEDDSEDEHDTKYHLVFDEKSAQLLLVTRHLLCHSPWESPFFRCYPCKTTSFDVHRVDRENKRLTSYMNAEGSLGGISIFIGRNHSLAISAPQLKPNSIYFTDTYGLHDIGVFDYENYTFSPSTFYKPRHVPNLDYDTPLSINLVMSQILTTTRKLLSGLLPPNAFMILSGLFPPNSRIINWFDLYLLLITSSLLFLNN